MLNNQNPVLLFLSEKIERLKEVEDAAALVARGAHERASSARASYKSEPSEKGAITMLEAVANANSAHQAWIDAAEQVTEAMEAHKFVMASLVSKEEKRTIQ